MDSLHPTYIEIDLDQFKKNLSLIKSSINKSLYCLPIKANAYGHGLIPIAKAASEIVDYFGVSSLKEGAELRKAGIKTPILVFGAFHENQILKLIEYNLEFSISSYFKAKLVYEQIKQSDSVADIHLELDTGMRRTGPRVESALKIYQFIKSKECFNLKGIYSHFAKAEDPDDNYTLKQMSAYEKFLSLIDDGPYISHICNSSGFVYFPKAYYNMIRPGLLSFGLFHRPINAPLDQIKSCFSLKSHISYFKVVDKGEGISYGHQYITSKMTRIATVPIGYGDGLRRGLSNKGHVLIRGYRYPIVGMICMDQLMVDIGDGEAFIDDEVVLIGKQGEEQITVQEMASHCDTIPYEILCHFNERVPRIYN